MVTPGKHLILCYNKEEVTGFIFLSDGPAKYSSFLKLGDILIFFKNLIFKPILGIDILRLILNQYSLKGDEIEIAQFAVSAIHQSRGVGTKLLNKTMEIARKSGKKKIITVTHNVALIDFYQRTFGAEVFKKLALNKQNYFWLRWNS